MKKTIWLNLTLLGMLCIMLLAPAAPTIPVWYTNVQAAPADPATPCSEAVDLVFVLDTTGSMGGALASINHKIADFLSQIDTLSKDVRIGLVVLKSGDDFEDQVYVIRDLSDATNDLNDTTDDLIEDIRKLQAEGGARPPEPSDEALNTVINNLRASDREQGQQINDFTGTWRDDAKKIIVLVTDAEPGGFDDMFDAQDELHARQRADEAASKGIEIVSIFVPTAHATAKPETAQKTRTIMEHYADHTGGLFFESDTTGSNVGEKLEGLLKLCEPEREPEQDPPYPPPEPGRPDVWMRDNTDDVGREPSSGTAWSSPDIKVCGNPNGCPVSENPIAGYDGNYVFITLHNNGPNTRTPPQPAQGSLYLYVTRAGGAAHWVPGAPDDQLRIGDWTLIGSMPNISIPANQATRTVVIPWTADKIPATGHYCLLARWVSADDPMTFAETSHTIQNAQNNNNIAWRNVDAVPMQPGLTTTARYIVRAPAEDMPTDVVIRPSRTFPGKIIVTPGNLANPAEIIGEGIIERTARTLTIAPQGGRLIDLRPRVIGDPIWLTFEITDRTEPGQIFVDVVQEAVLPGSNGIKQDIGGVRYTIDIIAPDAPPVATTPAIRLTDEGIRLSWPHFLPNKVYEIWRSPSPVFVPGAPGTVRLGQVAAPADVTQAGIYIDTTIRSRTEKAYYIIRSINPGGQTADSRIVTVTLPVQQPSTPPEPSTTPVTPTPDPSCQALEPVTQMVDMLNQSEATITIPADAQQIVLKVGGQAGNRITHRNRPNRSPSILRTVLR